MAYGRRKGGLKCHPKRLSQGGFSFENGFYEQPARAGRWANASGAVYHISSAFLSMQCLVDRVENTTGPSSHTFLLILQGTTSLPF